MLQWCCRPLSLVWHPPLSNVEGDRSLAAVWTAVQTAQVNPGDINDWSSFSGAGWAEPHQCLYLPPSSVQFAATLCLVTSHGR